LTLLSSSLNAERHKLEYELNDRERQLTDLRKRSEEIPRLLTENRNLREEFDILREKAAKNEGLEERIKKLSIRADQANDLKKQLMTLEQQQDTHLREKLDLEEQVKQLGRVKTQLETYKDQVTSLTAQSNSQSHAVKELGKSSK
jgi:uncharacterized protein YigA (DUF484 family)